MQENLTVVPEWKTLEGDTSVTETKVNEEGKEYLEIS